MNTAGMIKQYEDEERARILKERNDILDRKEAFELKMLNMKLASLDRLSDSISNLASSMSKNRSGPVFNFYIENLTADQLSNIKEICDTVSN